MISIKHEIKNNIDDPNAIASLVALGMRLEAVSCDGSLFPWGEMCSTPYGIRGKSKSEGRVPQGEMRLVLNALRHQR